MLIFRSYNLPIDAVTAMYKRRMGSKYNKCTDSPPRETIP